MKLFPVTSNLVLSSWNLPKSYLSHRADRSSIVRIDFFDAGLTMLTLLNAVECGKLRNADLLSGAIPMFLTRIFAPFGNALFNRSARAQQRPAEECVILKRLRELREATPHVAAMLSPNAGGMNAPPKRTEI